MAKFRNGTLRVLTANDLLTGDVVFLTAKGIWSRNLDEARLAATPGDIAILEAHATSAEAQKATATAYTIDVERQPEGRLRPLRTREKIRITGPLAETPQKPGKRKTVPRPKRTAGIAVRMPAIGFGDDHVSL